MARCNQDKNGEPIVISEHPMPPEHAFSFEPSLDESQHPKIEVDGMFRVTLVYPAWREGKRGMEQNYSVVYRAESADEARRVRIALKSALLIGAHCATNEANDGMQQAMRGLEEWLR